MVPARAAKLETRQSFVIHTESYHDNVCALKAALGSL